jgi:hypothetical protein
VVEIKPIISEITFLLMNGASSRVVIMTKFCAACIVVRKKGLMCELCKRSNSRLRGEECVFCMSATCLQ